MEMGKMPKWREEIEAILREKLAGGYTPQLQRLGLDLIDLAEKVERPSGDMEKVLAVLLKSASDDLYPLAAVYAGFSLGVAYERYQNASGA